MDIVDTISNSEVTYRNSELGENEEAPKDAEGNPIPSDKPVNPPVITSMTVETYGANYGEPKTVKPFDYMNWVYSNYGASLNS